MSRSKTTKKRTISKSPAVIARNAAEKYFTALAQQIPFDAAPGDVNLIGYYNDIREALMNEKSCTTS